MIFTLTFKTNDVTDGSPADLCNEAYSEEQREEAAALVEKFVEHKEYISIEFNTETKTALVVPRK